MRGVRIVARVARVANCCDGCELLRRVANFARVAMIATGAICCDGAMIAKDCEFCDLLRLLRWVRGGVNFCEEWIN